MDDDRLREFHDSHIDPATLEKLFVDLDGAAEILAVMAKGGAKARAHGGTMNLSEGKELFMAKKVRGLQIRYRFQGSEWWDTLMHTPGGGVRIIRIEQNDWE
jgi:hypothetical protein